MRSWKKTVFFIIIILLFVFLLMGVIVVQISNYHKIVLSLILIGTTICVESILIFLDKDNQISAKSDETIDFYIKKKELWLVCHWIWLCAYYLISSISLLSSCIIIHVSFQSYVESDDIIIFYSIIALFMTFLNMIVKPLVGSKSYRNAYILMQKNIIDYINNVIKKEELANVFKECEDEITRGLF